MDTDDLTAAERVTVAKTLLNNLRRELPSGTHLHTTEQQSRMIAEAQAHALVALADILGGKS